jgi:hypothetical protein
MKTYTLTLTEVQADIVFRSLGAQPYQDVSTTMETIKNQVIQQNVAEQEAELKATKPKAKRSNGGKKNVTK